MKYRWALWLALAHASPVQKVLDLLTEMKMKGALALEVEKKQQAEYSEFCRSTLKQKEVAILEGSERIERLKADLETYGASLRRLSGELELHEKEMRKAQAEAERTGALRAQEEMDHKATLQEYQESMSAIRQATEALKTSQVSLAQRSLRSVKQLEEFLETPKAYDFQSKGVLEMLESLATKFGEEKAALEALEAKAKASHLLLMKGLGEQEASIKQARAEKLQFKSKAVQSLAKTQSEVAESSKMLAEDVKYRKELVMECEKKSLGYVSSLKLREKELKAVGEALEIIKSKVFKAGKQLSSLVQGSSLALLRAPRVDAALKFLDDVALIREVGDKERSLQEVKQLLQKHLANLKSARVKEIEHESFCRTELSGNNRSRQFKASSVESLTAEIEQLRASLATISSDAAELSTQLAELSGALAEATRLRATEKAAHLGAVAEARAAQRGVGEAMELLAALQGDQGAVVLQLLERLLADFARAEAEQKALEEQAERDFRAFSEESRLDEASKRSDAAHLAERKMEQSRGLAQREADLAQAQGELAEAQQYFQQLEKRCVSSDSQEAKAKAWREKEIENLKMALKQLES